MVTQIMPYLWLGSYNDCVYLPEGIQVVVNCTEDIPFFYEHTTNIRIPIGSEVCGSTWKDTDAFNKIIESIMSSRDVLIHCKDGMEASGATVAAFFMKMNRLPLDAAVLLVRKRTRLNIINGVYLSALEEFARILQSMQSKICVESLFGNTKESSDDLSKPIKL